MKELLVASPFPAHPMLGIWARVELMGHRQLHGFVTEVEAYGARMLRVDVPHPNPEVSAPVFTQVYGGGALFCLTPLAEAEVRRNVERYRDDIVVPHRTGSLLPMESDYHREDDDQDETIADDEPIADDYYHAS